jgi:signal transduction histidine kinase
MPWLFMSAPEHHATRESRARSLMRRIPARSRLGIAAVAFVLLGLLALWAAHGPARIADGVPGLVAGWALGASGIAAWSVAPWSRVGPLLAAAGLAWFIPDLATCLNVEPFSHRCLRLDAIAEVSSALRWAWLGIVASAVVTFPEGRADTLSRQLAVGVATVAALALPIWPDPARGVMAVLLVAGPLWLLTRPGQVGGPEGLAAPLAGTTLAAGLILPAGLSYGSDGSVILASVVLLVGVTAVARRRASFTIDRAVELGTALAGALGDPGFRVAFREPGRESWMDADGAAIDAPVTPQGMESTTIERDGQVVAVITHDPQTLSDPLVRIPVERAVELAAHNARLRADLDAQLRALDSSRRRLVDAGLREREALGEQVQGDVLRRLDALQKDIDMATIEPLQGDAKARLGQAAAQIKVARTEIEDLASGLYPATLATTGLAGALADLARRSPVGVALDIPPGSTGGPDVDATLYFVCAEALANVARHAKASRVNVTVASPGDALAITVTDNGTGGASPGLGSGLRGLQDRVEAMGGVLTIDSLRGAGTRLAATIPVSREAHGSS